MEDPHVADSIDPIVTDIVHLAGFLGGIPDCFVDISICEELLDNDRDYPLLVCEDGQSAAVQLVLRKNAAHPHDNADPNHITIETPMLRFIL
jgi:hypothetical protein